MQQVVRQLRRRSAPWLVAVGAGLLLTGSAAFACTNLATLNLSSSMGKPGDVITLTGSGFLASADEMPMDGMAMEMGAGGSPMAGTTAGLAVRSPVLIRWNGPDGPVLSDAVPDRSGTISVVFTIPETRSGQYTVVAVQKNPQGYDVYGTPARAPLQVIGAGGSTGDGVRGAGPEGAGESSSTGILALTVSLGILGVGLLAAGGIAATRTARARWGVPVKIDGQGH